MDRSALLNSLPFLYKVAPNGNGPLIWKQHLNLISQYLAGKDDNSSAHLFPCHALSIEPIAHHCGDTAGVAFFSNTSTWDNTNSISSTEEGEAGIGDPALVDFTAFLLSAYYQRYSEDGNVMKTPLHKQKPIHSPALSSASTAMTNSHSPRTPRGARGGDAGVTTMNTAPPADETHVLYFVVDQEIYCVDHCQIRSIEVEEPTNQSLNDNFGEHGNVKPMSLLLTFDSCTFRVFYDNDISNSEQRSVQEQETLLRNCFLKLKTFMLSEGTKLAEFRSSNDSFVSYLGQLGRPDYCGESSVESQAENGQTSNPHNSIATENSMRTSGEVDSRKDDAVMDDSDSIHGPNPISSRLDAYENSWKSLQALHCLLKTHKRRKVANSLDQGDKLFAMLANKSAQECTRSYVDSEVDINREERREDEDLSKIQESIDIQIQMVFPAKKNHSSTPNKSMDGAEDGEFGARIMEELSNYKVAVNAKHRSLGFIPKR
jgi:hypothetical protein